MLGFVPLTGFVEANGLVEVVVEPLILAVIEADDSDLGAVVDDR